MTRLTHGHHHSAHLDYTGEVAISGHKELLKLTWRNVHLRHDTDLTTGRPPVVKASLHLTFVTETEVARTIAALYEDL